MRYDCHDGWRGDCFDVQRCCRVLNVRWVDTDTAQWCELVEHAAKGFPLFDLYDHPTRIHQERRIRVIEQGPKRLFALFNEVDDDGSEGEVEIVGLPREHAAR